MVCRGYDYDAETERHDTGIYYTRAVSQNIRTKIFVGPSICRAINCDVSLQFRESADTNLMFDDYVVHYNQYTF